ncbi:hypothetical protein CO172_01405 [Candidatus Uhrbacteria bacterium CG_4_9_14_3_um_filter_36_7]|uniref:Insulinase family protein n=1 Tax=Candidatus Uhrbacteria bacterium CG_4_9_14_3_um_filter_36_7 TaxID=1975033 RepID=A0A2M7XI91_9BACT|nr:MAG: hypothetical protein CO172_01405 [Candidatus Uhrbacteria bacterium CG_4_9_14_3_um_filter_36_7]
MSFVKQLKNGLRIHLLPLEGTQTTTVLVLCKVGSRYEGESLRGVSHFIEHLMFKGTKKRPSAIKISRLLDEIGAEFNAYTGKDLTGYYIKTESHHQKLGVELLHDMLAHSLFKPSEMNRERKVILEEIHMYHDNPLMHVDELLEETLFASSTLGWEIAGTTQSIESMKRQDLFDFQDTYYTPSRMVVVVAGKIDPTLSSFLERTFGTLKSKKDTIKDFVPFSLDKWEKGLRMNIQFKDTKQIQLAIGFPAFGMKDSRVPAAKLLALIVGGAMSSRLFLSVRERQGLAYMIRSGFETYEDTGFFWIQAGLDKTRFTLALQTIFKELRLLKKNGVKASEIAWAREHIRGRTALQFEDSASQAEWIARQELFLEKTLSIEAWLKKYEQVRSKDIKAIIEEIFQEERLCIAAIGPFADKQAFAAFLPKTRF